MLGVLLKTFWDDGFSTEEIGRERLRLEVLGFERSCFLSEMLCD